MKKIILILLVMFTLSIAVSQVTQVVIPNPENTTQALTIDFPDGTSLPIGFNQYGAMVFVIMLLTGLVKKFPVINQYFVKLFPNSGTSQTVIIAFIAGIISGEINLLLGYLFGYQVQASQKELIMSSLGLASVAISAHTLLGKTVFQKFLMPMIKNKLK